MAIVINPATYAPKTWSWDKVKQTVGIYFFADSHTVETLARYVVFVPVANGVENKTALIAIPQMSSPHTLEVTHSLDPYTFHPYRWETTNLWTYLCGNISVEAFRETLTRMK